MTFWIMQKPKAIKLNIIKNASKIVIFELQ